MKITAEHREHMKQAMQARLASYPPESHTAYLESIQKDPRVKDWEKRYRWDLCYAAGLTPWICETLYSYANDSHIDTALKAIMKEISGESH